MSERIVMRTGEALVEGAEDYLCAEPEIVIGELDGPVGHALANLIGDQVKGHSRVFAILNSDVQVKPATVMVSKVTCRPAGNQPFHRPSCADVPVFPISGLMWDCSP
jgi:5,6,7,8-tetrahydromethanopterin hydro-lyase